MQLGDGTYEINDGDNATTVTVEVTDAGGGGQQGFSRHAADLRRFGKDRFVIQVTLQAPGSQLSAHANDHSNTSCAVCTAHPERARCEHLLIGVSESLSTTPHVCLQVLKDGDDFDPQDPASDQDEGDDDSSLYERVLLDLTEANGEPADISRRLTVWT